jgi:hypothetical protein
MGHNMIDPIYASMFPFLPNAEDALRFGLAVVLR